MNPPATPAIPVILDTDIGDDIDDTWALLQLLQSPELNLRLVTVTFRDTVYRARLACKLLHAAGRTDVPVGIGTRQADIGSGGRQSGWLQDYRTTDYPGRVHPDGVQALIDVIRASAPPITLLSIGPLPNIAEALRRAPDIAARTRFVGMHGSVYRGYGGKPQIDAEWNVRADAASAQAVFAAPWRELILTPLDTCGLVVLRGDAYRRVAVADTPAAQAVIQNYRVWRAEGQVPVHSETESSVLFDTVAVHLAHSTRWLTMQRLGLRITDDGFTIPDPRGQPVQVATAWTDIDAFQADLVRRLLAPGRPAPAEFR